MSEKLWCLIFAFERGEFSERCYSHLLSGYFWDLVEARKLTF